MNITDIKMRKTYNNDTRLRAMVSLTLDGDFAIHDIKVIEGSERLFIAMPSRRDENGTFRDICHPITPEARCELERQVLAAYREYLEANFMAMPDSGGIAPPESGIAVGKPRYI